MAELGRRGKAALVRETAQVSAITRTAHSAAQRVSGTGYSANRAGVGADRAARAARRAALHGAGRVPLPPPPGDGRHAQVAGGAGRGGVGEVG
jgi:hypothetical protein